jgi:hypothetical protein
MLVSDLITAAFEDVGLIAVGETIPTAIQTDAFSRLNQIIDLVSADGLTNPNQVTQTFNLSAGVTAYTLGSGGTLATFGGLRALKVTAWRAFYQGILHTGGRVLSLAEFGQQAKQILGEQSAVPGIVGADVAFPLINVRVFPPPSFTPGQLELAYLTPIPNFATVGDTVTSMAHGLVKFLRALLAQDLFPQYGRPAMKDVVWDNVREAKQSLIVENAMSAPQPQPNAPQGQK